MSCNWASLGIIVLCLSYTSLQHGEAQATNPFQSLLDGLLPSDAAAISPFLGILGPQLLPLPTEADKQATLCSTIAEKQLPISLSFCTTPPAGKTPPPPFQSSPLASVPEAPLVPIPAAAPAPNLSAEPPASCLIATTRQIFFNASATQQPDCLICGGFTFSCNGGGRDNDPTPPSFMDTSNGTFVGLQAQLTSSNVFSNTQGLVTLLINNAVQGTFQTDIYTSGTCGLGGQACDNIDMVVQSPQTGYKVGGLNDIAFGNFQICYTELDLTVTINTCA